MIARRYEQRLSDAELLARLSNMTMILSAPRSGSTLLFDLLARTPGALTIGGESHVVYRQFPQLAAENAAFDSGMLDARHADPATIRQFRCAFLAMLRDDTGRLLYDLPDRQAVGRPIIEKTPRNALALPFLKAVFPAARFVFLYRHPADVIASLIEGWETGLRTGQFVTYRHLPGWDRAAWCFALPRGWRTLRGRSLAEIAAFQWDACNRAIVDRVRAAPDAAQAISYAELVADPAATMSRLGAWLGLGAAGERWRAKPLPISASTVSPPAPDKWLARRQEVSAVLEPMMPLWHEIEAWRRSTLAG